MGNLIGCGGQLLHFSLAQVKINLPNFSVIEHSYINTTSINIAIIDCDDQSIFLLDGCICIVIDSFLELYHYLECDIYNAFFSPIAAVAISYMAAIATTLNMYSNVNSATCKNYCDTSQKTNKKKNLFPVWAALSTLQEPKMQNSAPKQHHTREEQQSGSMGLVFHI